MAVHKEKPKIIGIIPARGGSKGVPRKNIRPLLKKPLIAYTIDSALKSTFLTHVVVSTEDRMIAGIAKKYGASVVTRPEYLATDDVKSIDVVFHVLDHFKQKKIQFDIVVLLQPTSPLRTSNDIDDSITLFLTQKCQSLVSVYEVMHSPYWMFSIEKKLLKPLFPKKFLNSNRQKLTKSYLPNGAIYISNPENLEKYNSFYSPRTMPFIMPFEKSVDIDTRFDFLLAKILLQDKTKK